MGNPQQQNQDPFPLADIFREHASGLAGAVRGVLGPRADTQEILQEAFLKAWRALDRGDRPAQLVAWVFLLTLNLARDMRRSTLRHGPDLNLNEVEVADMRTTEPGPASLAEGGEALDQARDAIYELAETEKEVFLMRVSGELSFKAIAQALGIPIGTAKTRMRTALRQLHGSLSGLGVTSQAGVGGVGMSAMRTEGETR